MKGGMDAMVNGKGTSCDSMKIAVDDSGRTGFGDATERPVITHTSAPTVPHTTKTNAAENIGRSARHKLRRNLMLGEFANHQSQSIATAVHNIRPQSGSSGPYLSNSATVTVAATVPMSCRRFSDISPILHQYLTQGDNHAGMSVPRQMGRVASGSKRR